MGVSARARPRRLFVSFHLDEQESYAFTLTNRRRTSRDAAGIRRIQLTEKKKLPPPLRRRSRTFVSRLPPLLLGEYPALRLYRAI